MGLPLGLEELEVPDSFNLTDVLDYTPSILEDSYKQFNSKQNRGIGFKKTVRTDFEDFEGMGKGQVVISDDKEKGTVTRWVPYMGKEWVDTQNQRFERAETIMNAPLHLAPLIAPFAARSTPHRTLIQQGNRQRQVGVPQPGGHTLRQRSQLNRYKMQFLKDLDLQRAENATNITPQRGSQIVRDVYSLKRTQPSKGLLQDTFTAEELGFVPPTTFMTTTGGEPAPNPEWDNDPRKDWETSEGLEEARVRKDQFEDAVLTEQGEDTKNPWVYKPEVKISPRGVHISKRKESGYKFNADISAEWNAWSKSTKFLDELADKPGTAFVEHLVGKGERWDFFWNLPDGEGDIRSWRPGTRHSPNNTRIFYGDRQKKLKDATENLLYPIQENLPDLDRFIVDYDLPEVKPGESITVRKPTGDIVIRRVDGTVVGRLGDYHDVLYAPAAVLAEALTTNINPDTGTFYIDPNTGNMKKAIRHWREKILLEKINLIIAEAPNLKNMSADEVYQLQAGAILEDQVQLSTEYSFIPKPSGNTLDAQLRAFGKEYTPQMETFFSEEPKGVAMLRDRIDGMTWMQLKAKYKDYRDNPELVETVYSQLTPGMIARIMKEYGRSGKEGYVRDLNKKNNDLINHIFPD